MDRAQRRARRLYRIALVLTLIACVLYACALLLASTLVAYLAGEADTGAGLAAVAIAVVLGTPAATWMTQTYLYRLVGQMVNDDGESDGSE